MEIIRYLSKLAKKANKMLGSTNKGITSRERKITVPLCSALARTPGILGAVWDHAVQNIMWTGWREKSTKMSVRPVWGDG